MEKTDETKEKSRIKESLAFVLFIILSLGIGALGYLPWVLASYGMFPSEPVGLFMLIGGGSPTIAAVIVMYLQFGGEGPKVLFLSFKRKFSPVWIAIALVLVFLMFYPAILIMNLVTTSDAFPIIDIVMFALYLVQMIIMNVWEEIGWRGYAQSVLQGKYNALVSSILVGFIWAAWHIPHFLVYESHMLQIYGSFPLFIGHTIVVSIIYAWLYNSANGNLFVVTLYHAASNSLGGLILLGGVTIQGVYTLLVNSIIAVAIILIFKAGSLSRKDSITLEHILSIES